MPALPLAPSAIAIIAAVFGTARPQAKAKTYPVSIIDGGRLIDGGAYS
jgi:hypothetical protein